MTDYNDGKWHGWNGGKCPVHPKSEIEYLWVSDSGLTGIKSRVAGEDERGVTPAWSKDLKAFRVVKEHREPKQYWVDYQDGKVLLFSESDIPEDFTEAGYIHMIEVLP